MENTTSATDLVNTTLHVDLTSDRSDPSHHHTALLHISQESYELLAFVSNSIVSPCVCLIGLIGNSLGQGVLWRDTRQQRLSIYTYLFCLTLVDSLYLFLGLIRNIPQILRATGHQALGHYIAEHMKLGTIYLDMVTAHTSRAILVVMSLERLFALVRPFTVKHFPLTKYPRQIVAACGLFNLLFLLPFPMYLQVASFTVGNTTEYFVQFRPHADSVAMETYMLVQTVVDQIVPCVVLLFTNTAILLTYSSILRRRLVVLNLEPSRVYQQKGKVTATVLFISLMFLLCSLPNLFIKVLAFVDSEYSFDGQHRVMFWFFIDLSNLFEYLNAANDSLIYILVSDHYRQIFRDMYCGGGGCCCGRLGGGEDGDGQDNDMPAATMSSPRSHHTAMSSIS